MFFMKNVPTLNSHRCVLHPGLQDSQRFHLDKQVSQSEYSTIDYGEGECSSAGASFSRRKFFTIACTS